MVATSFYILSEPTSKPIREPTSKSISKPISEPTCKPISKPISEPTSEPVSDTVSEPEWNIPLINLIGYLPIAANQNIKSIDHCLDN